MALDYLIGENNFWIKNNKATGIFSALLFCYRCLLIGWKHFFNKNSLKIFEEIPKFRWKYFFEKNHLPTRIPQQICYLHRLWKMQLFLKKPFFNKKTNCLTYLRNLTFSVAFYRKFGNLRNSIPNRTVDRTFSISK